MTSRPGASALPSVTRLVAVVLLVLPLAPTWRLSPRLPRFERGDCLVKATGRARSEVNAAGSSWQESRDRASTRTLRLAVEIFRARSRAARRRSSSCMGARVERGDPAVLGGRREESIAPDIATS